MTPTKRIRRDPSEAKALIMRTAERVLLEEGYAAISMRRVGKLAGVSSNLLHYYYATPDDLIIALYKYASDKDAGQMERALASDDPIGGLWAFLTDAERMSIGVEFVALSNHRKSIRPEIVLLTERARNIQVKAFSALFEKLGLDASDGSPLCLATLLAGAARSLVMERSVGVTLGHAEAHAYIKQVLSKFRVPPSD